MIASLLVLASLPCYALPAGLRMVPCGVLFKINKRVFMWIEFNGGLLNLDLVFI